MFDYFLWSLLGLLILVSVVYFIVKVISFIIKKLRGHILDKDKLVWLQGEIAKWRKSEIISPEQEDNLLKFYNLVLKEEVKRVNLIKVLSIIGTILLGIGVILFVASNWRQIPDIVRTIILLTITFGTFYLGYYFGYQREGYSILGKSLFFLASLFWGATIALIAQIYHIPTSDNWWIFLIWAFPILPVAWFFESTSVFILSSGLFLIWSFFFSVSKDIANYYYPMIAFIILLPLSKESKLRYLSNIVALIIAASFGLFNKYDWLVLLIAVGLLTYYFIKKRSLIYLISSSISFILWIITFFLAHEHLPNYFFVLPLGILFYLTYKDRSEPSLVINTIGSLVGINLFIYLFSTKIFTEEITFMTHFVLQSLIGVVLYLVGICHIREDYKPFKMVYKIFGFIITLIVTYTLSFKGLLEECPKLYHNPVYLVSCVILVTIALSLIVLNLMNGSFSPRYAKYELLMLILLLGGKFLILIKPELTLMNTVITNTILLLFAVISILYGFEIQNSKIFNIGVLIFVIFVVTRYFDVFWKLLDRSIFFIVGGLLMIIGSVVLERKRRKIIEEMGK